MRPEQLIGRLAIRINHCYGDWSFTDKPLAIKEVSERFITAFNPESYIKQDSVIHNDEEYYSHILDVINNRMEL